MASFSAAGGPAFNFDALNLVTLLLGEPSFVVSGNASYSRNGELFTLLGTGFSFDGQLRPIGGTVSRITDRLDGASVFEINGLSMPVAPFAALAVAGDNEGMKRALFGGADSFMGSGHDDLLRGLDGDDSISGAAGGDTLDGGAGNDTVGGGVGDDSIGESAGSNYLRGDEGADRILGGSGFDDINGNMGDDTASGGLGEDWVVGGKDNDVLSGGDAYDLVYGNLGSDTISGDGGGDIVRGGQQDDVLQGGDGDDYLSGDRDNDTITGGAGADIFHSFGEAGIDRVTDFSIAQGDRVLLDLGTTYTAAQVGADTVVSMTGGGQVILAGVSMSSLTGNWITVG